MIQHFFKKTHQKIKELSSRVTNLRRDRDEKRSLPIHLPKEEKVQKIEVKISAGTMVKFVAITILFLVLAVFIYKISDILVIFFVSLLFAAALDPMVDALERRRIPRALGVIIIYIVALFVIGFFVSSLVPVVATELAKLAGNIQEYIANIVNGKIELPQFLEGFRPNIKKFFEGLDVSQIGNYKDSLMSFANKLSDIAGNVFNGIMVVFNGFFNTIIVLVITFMMTVDEKGIDKFITSLFPSKYADYIQQKSSMIKEKMGYWLRGQVVLCFVIGLLTYFGLILISFFTHKMDYAATIALVAGFTEVIPYAGPFIAWLIAMPIVANQSPMLILWVTILMYVVQVLENNFIVPVVMNKAVGISPIFIMFAMFVGFSMLGVLGIVLSVPVATAVAIFVKDYADREK
ncbi:MAG: AI-2E family transporter [Patescibacteria group bacterium]